MSLSSHQSARMKNDEWLTPPEILAALGKFDLDPCAPVKRPWPMAEKHFTAADDGLSRPWSGRVWCNPPFGAKSAQWVERCSTHGNAIVLIAARTETKMFFDWVWPKADGILFLRGRPHFHYVDGKRAPFNSGAPICLVAYGFQNFVKLSTSTLQGRCVGLNSYKRPNPQLQFPDPHP